MDSCGDMATDASDARAPADRLVFFIASCWFHGDRLSSVKVLCQLFFLLPNRSQFLIYFCR